MEQNDTKKTVEQRLEDMLEKLKVDPLKVTPDAVLALWTPAQEALAAYDAALGNYEQDLRNRQAELDRQGQVLDGQIRDLEKKITALESQRREAASRGDLDGAATADEEAEDLRRQVTVARRKKRIADSTELRGDADLYAAIQEKQAAYTATLNLCGEYVREAVVTVKEWKECFEKLERETRWSTGRGPGDGHTTKRWETIDRAYNKEFYEQLAAETEAARKEREEAEEMKRRLFIYTS